MILISRLFLPLAIMSLFLTANATPPLPNPPFYSPGNALLFDGINDRAVSSPATAAPTSYTLEAWFRTTKASGGIVGFNSNSGMNAGSQDRLIFLEGTGKIRFRGGAAITSPKAYNDGRYHHVAGTFSAATGHKLYVDGELVASSSSTNPGGTYQGYWKAGGFVDPTGVLQYFEGRIDETRIWYVARTQTEIIQSMYTEISNPSALSSTLKYYYNFNATTDTVITDYSGNNNRLSLVNFDLNSISNNWVESYAMVVPQNVLISASDASSFTVAWDAPPSGIVEKYIMDIATDSTFSNIVYGGIDCGTNLSYQVTNIDRTLKHYYRVRAEKASVTNQARYVVGSIDACKNPDAGGTIAAAQSGSSPFDPIAFTSSAAPTGHNGTLEYKWQSSTTSSSAGFSDIAASNANVYDAGTLTQTTWFKRLARVSCKSDWTGAAESNVLEVTVTTPQPCTISYVPAITQSASTSCTANLSVSGSALVFDGVNDHVLIPNDLSTANSFTFEAWVYWSPSGSGNWSRIFDLGYGDPNQPYMFLTIKNGNTGKPWFAITDDYGPNLWACCESQIGAPSAFPQNAWTHLAVTLDGTIQVANMYINGALVQTVNGFNTLPSAIGATTVNYLGKSQYPDPYFQGKMDEVRFWNVARTQQEILDNMNFRFPPSTPNLVSYYQFDEGQGTSTANAAGNTGAGTLVNGTAWEIPNTSPSGSYTSYSWNTGATTSSIAMAQAGNYTVTVTDGNGCTNESSITVASSTINTTTVSACNSYNWSVDGNTYTQSGTYSTVIGCNTEILDLTILPSTINTTTATACDSYTWAQNGQTYTTSGTYSSNSNCQDYVLNLTVSATVTYYADSDGDGYGSNTVSSSNCTGAAPADYITATGDCNDNNANVNPGAIELCNSIDDDCDGVVDDNPLPVVTGSLSGTSLSCRARLDGTATFTLVGATPGAASVWTAPAGFSITSGQGTYTLNVSYTASAIDTGIIGPLCMNISDACGSSASVCTDIDYQIAAPVIPPSISGPSKPCPGDVATFSFAAVARATSYIWTMPAGVTLLSGQGTNIVQVSIGAGFNGGNISAIATNAACGSGPARIKSLVNAGGPGTPTAIWGIKFGLCNSKGMVYSIPAVSGASSYLWSVTGGGVILSGQGNDTIIVDYPNFTSGHVTVQALSSCGASLQRTLYITGAPGKPEAITGAASVCRNATEVYSIPTLNGTANNGYNWTVTSAGTITSGQGTKSITVLWHTAATAQAMQLNGTNACGTGPNNAKGNISVNACSREDLSASGMQLEVYPNPAQERTHVVFNANREDVYRLSLTDMSGRTILSETGTTAAGRNEFEVYFGNVQVGVYFIEIRTGEAYARMRLVIAD